MKAFTLAASLVLLDVAGATDAACQPGAYGKSNDAFVVIHPPADAAQSGQRFLFIDGRRGEVSASGPVRCIGSEVHVVAGDGRAERWSEIPLTIRETSFVSVANRLVRRLIEPAQPATQRPLVAMVHGSERISAMRSPYHYILAAQGIAVFVYDKRGTGDSEGDYTQHFGLLAADAAAALRHARTLAHGRFDRSGYFGGSQAGWVAPLAATISGADFVAVGFGLVSSPIAEDRAQMMNEARALELDSDAIASIENLSRATARLVTSSFSQGFDEFMRVQREIVQRPWARQIHGEYSGEMLWMTEAELRRFGRAKFDALGIIWDYDSIPVLKRLNAPLLWVLAEEDREAPIETARGALLELKRTQPIDIYLFPQTDHGMSEFVVNADGSRTRTRITDGYLKLVGDWIKRRVAGPYGRAKELR